MAPPPRCVQEWANGRRPPPGDVRPQRAGTPAVRILRGYGGDRAENIRESTLEGIDAAGRKGNHGGRPPVITDDMLHTTFRRHAHGETVEDIQPDLLIPTGRRKGQNPRALIHARGWTR